MFSSSVQTVFPDPLIKLVEQDVLDFVERELVIYKQNPDNKRIDDSVIVNIALFDLGALKYQNGLDQINNLFRDHTNQVVNRRLVQLLHTLHIRYGSELVDNLAERVLSSMVGLYGLDERVIRNLDNNINTFWLQPFIREAYDEINYAVTEEQ